MTVPNNKTREDYVGDGATSEWDYTFKIFNDSELVVIYTDDEDIDYELTLNTDYTVTEAGHPDGGKVKLQSGGTLTSATLTSSEKLSILRSLPVTQLVDLRNQRAFFADTHEDVFDRLTILIQQDLEQSDRSVRLPQSINPDDVDTTMPKPVGGRAVGWNSAGNALVNLEDFSNAEAGSLDGDILQWNFSTKKYEARTVDFEEPVDSASDLRSTSFPSVVNRIWLSGYYGVGTAGGGPLYRDSSDTTTADNGVTVFVDADGVRWKRSLSPAATITMEMAGAKGDGTNDDGDAARNAYAAIGSMGGGTLRFTSGKTYVLGADTSGSRAIKATHSNVTFHIETGATIRYSDGVNYSQGLISNISSGPVNNILFTGGGTIDGRQSTGTGGPAIHLSGETHEDINCIGVRFTNCPSVQFFVEGVDSSDRCRRIHCQQNIFWDNENEACLVVNGDNITMSDNIVVRQLATPGDQDGLEPSLCSNFVIADNTLINVASSAIDVFKECVNGTITGNVCIDEGSGGINQDQIIIGGGGSNNPCHHITCANNVVRGGRRNGIQIRQTTIPDHNITIDGNVVEGSVDVGIVVDQDAYNITVTNNICENNGSNGIGHNGDDALITGNVCRNNGQNNTGASGIVASGTRPVVTGNIAYDDQGTATQYYGISDMGATDALIVGNSCRNNVVDDFRGASSTTRFSANQGFSSEVNKEVTFSSGATVREFTHDLGKQPPGVQSIQITPTSSLGAASEAYVSTLIGSTEFRINMDVDPGTDVTFAVHAVLI